MKNFVLEGNILDPVRRKIYKGKLYISEGRIERIEELSGTSDVYIVPGLVDAHIHIESSMSTPLAFSREAVKHGTIAAVCDPHEIANVLGEEGVEYMLANAARSPFKFLFGVPSCVPATSFETSGAVLDSVAVERLLDKEGVGFLAEMMNYPGVIAGDLEIGRKIEAALKRSYPVDGHAPGLRGKDLERYAAASISTDHECFELDEAREKIGLGMKVLIREGSGAKNFEALIPLLNERPDMLMFCTDDSHPDDLVKGHINLLVKRALAEGYNLFDVIRAASYNPVHHYALNVGLLQVGDPADFLLVDSPENFTILKSYINGEEVFDGEQSLISFEKDTNPNVFITDQLSSGDLALKAETDKIRVIEIIDGELITKSSVKPVLNIDGFACSDPGRDILKIVVINRYRKEKPGVAFIHGMGLRSGAMATSVAHDSHNIIAVGTNDNDLVAAINWVIESKGGMVVVNEDNKLGLSLPVAGIMSDLEVGETADLYQEVSTFASTLGTGLKAPFMTLSFMALLVIPELKLSDKGLFDGKSFSFTPLFV